MNERDEGRKRCSDSNCVDSNSDCTSNNKNRKLQTDAETKNEIQTDLNRFKGCKPYARTIGISRHNALHPL